MFSRCKIKLEVDNSCIILKLYKYNRILKYNKHYN